MRRNLSGIYYFDKFDNEEKRQPTCFEDCQESTQDKIMENMSPNELIALAKKLADVIKDIGNQLDLTRE